MKQYKPRDKVTQKITREGAVEENQTTGKSENISGKEKEADFSGRLHFTEEDRAMPELDRYIRKAEQAADKAEAARERIPKKKKLTRERLYDEAKSKGKTKLRFKEVEKPMSEVEKTNPVSRPASLAGRMITGKAHGKIHEVEKENSGVEAGHSIERTGERALSKSSGMAKTALRNHRLKPYREAAKAERALHKANVNFQYHKALSENPSLSSNPLSRFLQKQKIKHNYTKDVKNAGKAAGKTGQAADAATKKTAQAGEKGARFIARHWKGALLVLAIGLLILVLAGGISSCTNMVIGGLGAVTATSYPSEEQDMKEVEAAYTAME